MARDRRARRGGGAAPGTRARAWALARRLRRVPSRAGAGAGLSRSRRRGLVARGERRRLPRRARGNGVRCAGRRRERWSSGGAGGRNRSPRRGRRRPLDRPRAGRAPRRPRSGATARPRGAGTRTGLHPPSVCHGGALDPFAEGLILLLAGQATRLMDLLHPIPKTYVATVAWGSETDNGDLLGRVVARGQGRRLTAERLDGALAEFVGWRDQVPPPTSNKRIDGERAYRKAHRGEPVELPPSRVYLHEARWLSHRLPESSTLFLVSGGGYYVRSLARDLGRATGARAHLTALRRVSVGPWEDPAPGQRIAVVGAALFPWCASVHVDAQEVKALRAGKSIPRRPVEPAQWPLPAGFPDPGPPLRALHEGTLVAMLRGRGEE